MMTLYASLFRSAISLLLLLRPLKFRGVLRISFEFGETVVPGLFTLVRTRVAVCLVAPLLVRS